MGASSESDKLKIVDHGERIATLEADQRNLTGVVKEFSITVEDLTKSTRDLAFQVERIDLKFWPIVGLSSLCSSVVTAIIVSSVMKMLHL